MALRNPLSKSAGRRAKAGSPRRSAGVSDGGQKEAEGVGRAAMGLLAALADTGAYGCVDDEGRGERLIVAAPRRGISVRVASFPVAAGKALCADGLALWARGARSGRERLEITEVGRARLARESAPDGVDPFLAQHKPLVRRRADDGASIEEVTIDQAESPLAWLASRKGPGGAPLVDAASLEAGERLRRDLTFASMLPRVTANWSAAARGQSGAGGAMTYSDVAIAARQRVEAAMDFVGGDFAGLLFDVCGFLKGLETIETERGWPRRSAKLVLVLALRQLARHYGLDVEARGPARSKGLRHWGADDYRPSITDGDGA